MSDVIFCSSISWDFLWQRPQALATALTELQHRVLFIAPTPSVLTSPLRPRMVAAPVQRCQSPVLVAAPPRAIMPFTFRDLLTDFDRRRFMAWLQRECDRHRFQPSVAYLGTPWWWNDLITRRSLARLGDLRLIYDCCDDFAALTTPARAAKRIAMQERQLLREADTVFATSAKLVDRFQTFGRTDVVELPNGVDFELFSGLQSMAPIGPVSTAPPALILFIGAIAPWVDLRLIYDAARRRPDWRWRMVGPVMVTLPADSPPNVEFVGEVPYVALPQHIAAASVCMVPFDAANPITQTVNACKMYQYLAAGKPVVSTPMPEMVRLGDLVAIAKTGSEWVEAIERLLQSDSPSLAAARQSFARDNTWLVRARRLSEAFAISAESGPRA